ncbi:ABC transporter substrate-binding protein [Azohydromonas caseinilytica]|uniref:ABC transporter substrate-binding protein n=1 Tax=Azohydromonas caseinilytica TaxID=2728836 RepID=A0A848FII7_9BURK|nr:ABC transporter substrate-binding protein [Azohydromonas caseinilytica]NML18020.1 ABC transporter substrate-binding protein [Azohydromonas caseinilytica]
MSLRQTLLTLGAAFSLSCTGLVWAEAPLVYCSEGSPESLNPQRTLSGTARNATATTLYDRLVDFEPGTTKIVPALAQSWTVSADKRTYEFTLRRGVKFHSTAYFTPSRDFNADDVLFSFNRQLRPDHPYHKVGGGNYQYFQGLGMDKVIASITRVDEHKVRIVLNRPEAPFLSDLAMPFMSILSAEYGTKLLAAGEPEELDRRPIGTGPYAFVSATNSIRYTAHPAYWNGAPKTKQLVFAITPDASVRLQKVRRGECHMAVSPAPADLPAIRRDPRLVLDEAEGVNVGYLALNMQKPPFDNVLVRRAFAHALNKQAYVDAVWLGNATVAINPYPAGQWSWTDQVSTYAYDPAKARALLAQAGYPNGFSATLWTLPVSRPYLPNGRKLGEMMQADLAKVGIRVELATFDWGTYLDKVRRGEHQIVQLGWGTDNGDPDNFLYTLFSCDAVTRGSNNARYCKPDFDALITEARVVQDPQARAALYRKALAVLSRDVPLVPIAHAKVYRVMSTQLTGRLPDPLDLDHFRLLALKDH